MKERRDFRSLEDESMGADYVTPSNIFHWQGTIIGPKNSPYEDGVFLLDIKLPEKYPFCAPRMVFLTPVYHPNISVDGDVHLEILGGNWSAALTIKRVMMCIRFLLENPDWETPLRLEIALEMKRDYKLFCLKARKSTWAYAK